jgi:murein DD-endopeptidase MepM/ murein hydrolase activator NlpD
MVKPVTKVRLRVLLIFAVAVAAVSLIVWVQSRRRGHEPATIERIQSETQPSPTSSAPLPEASASVSPVSVPSPADMKADPGALLENNQVPVDTTVANSFVGTLKLIVPVAGVKPDQLLDTFTDSRTEGRVHDAIDIPAPAGTPVLAVADGEIIKLFQSERGGTTIYQLSPDRKLVFYYAHLQRYADGIAVGKFVRQGEVIAFVGDTGNAGAQNYHLHFSISISPDPERYWEGKNINPYPLLRGK